jgi:hypothetical protein
MVLWAEPVGAASRSVAHLFLNRVTVSGNSATGGNGGGITTGWRRFEPDSAFQNVTISHNSANNGCGGGILHSAPSVPSAGPSLSIFTTTITENTASDGAGLCSGGVPFLQLTNTIVANNARSGKDYSLTESPPLSISRGHNLDSDGTCAFTGPGDLSRAQPRLGPLADNGGLTQTHALLANSPAIDTGDNATCPATDQRGVGRPIDGTGDGGAVCDMGAYEAPAPVAALDPTSS